MAFKLESPAEAYAAVSLLITGADGAGTLVERKFLFETLSAADVFSGPDPESMGELLGTLTGRMFSDLPNDGVALTSDAVQILCDSAKRLLDEDQCRAAFSLAANLACCDELEEIERNLLIQIADGLEVDTAEARSLIDRAEMDRAAQGA